MFSKSKTTTCSVAKKNKTYGMYTPESKHFSSTKIFPFISSKTKLMGN